MDRQEEVDGDDVAEERWIGYYASHSFASLRRTQEGHYWALRVGPPYQQGVRRMTEAWWARLHHNRLPAIFGQSGATSVSPSDDVITGVLN